MGGFIRFAGIALLVLSVIAVAVGVVFLYQGWSKNNLIKERMRIENSPCPLIPITPR